MKAIITLEQKQAKIIKIKKENKIKQNRKRVKAQNESESSIMSDHSAISNAIKKQVKTNVLGNYEFLSEMSTIKKEKMK